MIWLLDTNVVSVEFAPGRHRHVHDWLAANADLAMVSVISMGELERGIVRAATRDPAFASRLRHWQDGLETTWSDRVLPCSLAVARLWGRLTADLGRNDVDLLIAATALVHDLTVATRNVRHFAGTGVRLFNPWTGEGWARA